MNPDDKIIDTLDYEDINADDKLVQKPFYIFINVGKRYKFGIPISTENAPKLRNLKKGAYWCIDQIDIIEVPQISEEFGNERLALQKNLMNQLFPILRKNYREKLGYIFVEISRPKLKKYIIKTQQEQQGVF